MSIWPCYSVPISATNMYLKRYGQHERSDSIEKYFVSKLEIVCTIVQLSTCTNEHVLE